MRRFIVIVSILVILVAGLAIPAITKAFAADPGTQGQPSQSCQNFFPPGSLAPQGFNTGGFAPADVHYAGSKPQHSTNPKTHPHSAHSSFQNSQPHPHHQT